MLAGPWTSRARRRLAAAGVGAVALLLTSCASYDGTGLRPGQSPAGEVRALMGAPDAVRAAADGGQVWYYSRLPYGRQVYAARIGPNGVLRDITPRLTAETIARLRTGETSAEDALDLFGPPWESVEFERLARQVWTYPIEEDGSRRLLHLQFSADRLLREVYVVDESSPLPRWFFRF